MSRKAFSSLEDSILKEPQAAVAVSWIGDRKEFPAPGKDELTALNGVFSSMVTVGASRFCTGMVDGKWMISAAGEALMRENGSGQAGLCDLALRRRRPPLETRRDCTHGIAMKDPATGAGFLPDHGAMD